MKLYEIKEEYLEFLKLIDDGEVPEDAIMDTLEALNGAFEEKADNLAIIIKSLNYDAEAIKQEVKALNDRARAKQNRADWLTGYLYSCMRDLNRNEMETTRNKLKIKRNPAAVYCDDEMQFISWAQSNDGENYLSYSAPTLNKTVIKDALKSGAEIPFVELRQAEKLQIK